MLNVTKELTALARKLGYTGKAPDTVAKAINAITASVGGGGGEGGGGCDCEPGYEMVKTQLFSETVTTEDQGGMVIGVLAYALQINAPSLTVTFNGTDYQCAAYDTGDAFAYGGIGQSGPDFTNYPFTIVSAVNKGEGNQIYTETAGSYNVVVNANVAEVSAEFNAAVVACIGNNLPPMLCVDGVTPQYEIFNAAQAGRLLYFYDMYGACWIITDSGNTPMAFIPDNDSMSVGYDGDNIFTITYN